MKNSLISLKKIVVIAVSVGMLMLPVTVFSQEAQQEEENSSGSSNQQREEATSARMGSGPWQNSTSSVGTRDNSNAARPGSKPSISARPAAGSSLDGRDPGGNPDVPFDSKMNLAFLLTAVVFALMITRKKIKRAVNTGS